MPGRYHAEISVRIYDRRTMSDVETTIVDVEFDDTADPRDLLRTTALAEATVRTAEVERELSG